MFEIILVNSTQATKIISGQDKVFQYFLDKIIDRKNMMIENLMQ